MPMQNPILPIKKPPQNYHVLRHGYLSWGSQQNVVIIKEALAQSVNNEAIDNLYPLGVMNPIGPLRFREMTLHPKLKGKKTFSPFDICLTKFY